MSLGLEILVAVVAALVGGLLWLAVVWSARSIDEKIATSNGEDAQAEQTDVGREHWSDDEDDLDFSAAADFNEEAGEVDKDDEVFEVAEAIFKAERASIDDRLAQFDISLRSTDDSGDSPLGGTMKEAIASLRSLPNDEVEKLKQLGVDWRFLSLLANRWISGEKALSDYAPGKNRAPISVLDAEDERLRELLRERLAEANAVEDASSDNRTLDLDEG